MGNGCSRRRLALLLGPLFGGMLLAASTASGPQAKLLAAEELDQPADIAAGNQTGAQEKKDKEDLFKLDLERLMQVPVAPALSQQQLVTTVSRQESTVARSPAAIFVITPEMIRRSGARSVAEALRMVPGLDVARVDSSRWAISSRGFNSRLADKMLVQIDGRTIYNPIFSGIFWETQDLILQDIERIEVIRGPGATIWGQNAVNGIVNIITKRAQDTQGVLATAYGGSRHEGMTGWRYGGKLGEDMYYRIWGKWDQGGAFFSPDGPDRDDWRQGHIGFRSDWQATNRDAVTLEGELFKGEFGRTDIRSSPVAPFVVSRVGDDSTTGGHLLGRWRRQNAEKSEWTLTAFYDYFRRNITTGFAFFDYETFDLDFQQQFPLTCRQQLIYGLGYRSVDISARGSNFDNGFTISGTTARQVSYYSAFVQDEFTLVEDKLFFTAGCKFLENDFSRFFEYQPTGRLLWSPDEKHSLWAAISRAVRTPNFLDQNVNNTFLPLVPGVPVFPQGIGSLGFFSEDVIAYEAGYRTQPRENLSLDLAVFYNEYDNLATYRPGPAPIAGPVAGTFLLPSLRDNALNGETYGLELAANWKITDQWRVYSYYSFIQIQIHRATRIPPGGAESAFEGQTPQHQFYLQSSWDLTPCLEFDVIARYVDRLTGFEKQVPSYWSLDARLGWRPRQNLEIAVVGQNLLDTNHLEFGAIPLVPFPLAEVPRGVYGMITLRW